MLRDRRLGSVSGLVAVALALSIVGVAAQEEPQPATVAEIDAGVVSGAVTIDGAALVRADDEEYYFSDGLATVKIDIDTSNADPDVPLMTLINIVGTTSSDEIDVSSWTELEEPAADLGPREEEFMAWVALLGDDDDDSE